jgi:hypothetical protein
MFHSYVSLPEGKHRNTWFLGPRNNLRVSLAAAEVGTHTWQPLKRRGNRWVESLRHV